MNRTVLASFSDFPFAFIGIIVGIVELVMVFKSNKEYQLQVYLFLNILVVFQFLLVKRQYIAATGRVHGTDDVIAYHVRSMWHTDRQVTLRNSGRNMRKKFCSTRLLRMLLMRYMYNIPVPQTDKGFPFFEKATLAYFPKNIFDLIKRAYRY